MGVKWTTDQQHAIECCKGSVLVSAAAGSGKTTVLVERVIRRLTDEDNPCSAEDLLIVTFTRAATAQMREKIGAAILKRLSEDPTDRHLRRQYMLLPFAPITAASPQTRARSARASCSRRFRASSTACPADA